MEASSFEPPFPSQDKKNAGKDTRILAKEGKKMIGVKDRALKNNKAQIIEPCCEYYLI
jgi:hypothetical protein